MGFGSRQRWTQLLALWDKLYGVGPWLILQCRQHCLPVSLTGLWEAPCLRTSGTTRANPAWAMSKTDEMGSPSQDTMTIWEPRQQCSLRRPPDIQMSLELEVGADTARVMRHWHLTKPWEGTLNSGFRASTNLRELSPFSMRSHPHPHLKSVSQQPK